MPKIERYKSLTTHQKSGYEGKCIQIQGTSTQQIQKEEVPWVCLYPNPLAAVLYPNKSSPSEISWSESGNIQSVFWIPDHCGSYLIAHRNGPPGSVQEQAKALGAS